MYIMHIPSSPYLYSDSTKMSDSSDLLSAILQLDLYVYTGFPPIERLLAKPQPKFGTSLDFMDILDVPIMN
jgi:hypothetical protein